MSRKPLRRRTPDIVSQFVRLGAIGSIAVAPAGIVLAQDGLPEGGGVLFELTLGQTLEASDNLDLEDPAEGGFAAITSVSGSVSSITRSRALRLEFDTGLKLDEDGFVVDDALVDLSYLMASERSELEVFGSYRLRDASTEELVDLDGVGDLDLSVTTGTETTIRYGARVLVGRGEPLSFALSAAQSESDFSDPGSVDSQRLVVDGTVTGALDAATEVRATASYDREEEEDVDNSTETTTTAGLGLTRRLGNASTVSVDVDWQEIRSTGATDEVVNGIGGALSFDRDLPNGSFGVSASRDITINGAIDELRLSRGFEFPASTLTVEAGAILTGGDTVSPLLGLTYERLAPDGAISVFFGQDAGIDDDDATVLNTVGRATYTRQINAVSSYSAAVSLRNQSQIGEGDATRFVDASLTYNRALTDDVDVSLGYEHSRRFETGTAERTSNTVFVTLSRTFSAQR